MIYTHVKSMWEKGLVLSLVMILVISTIGGTMAVASEKRELTMWEWKILEDPKSYMPALLEFEKRYNVKVIRTEVTSSDMYTKARIAAEVGKLPDVMMLSEALVPEFVERGWIQSLGPFVEKEGRERFLDDFIEGTIKVNTYKGKLYGLPIDWGIFALWYNKEYFANAGIARPPQTWEELRETAIKLNNPDKKIHGLITRSGDFVSFYNAMSFGIQNSGHIAGKLTPGRLGRVNSIEEIGIVDPEWQKGLQFLADLWRKDKVTSDFATTTGGVSRELFGSGRGAMLCLEAWWPISYMPEDLREKSLAIAPAPRGKYQGTGFVSGGSWYMTTQEKNKELAWEWIRFATTEAYFIYHKNGLVSMPAWKPATQSEYVQENPLLIPYVQEMEWKYIDPTWMAHLPPKGGDALDFWWRENTKAALGQVSLEQAMKTVAKYWMDQWNEWEDMYGG